MKLAISARRGGTSKAARPLATAVQIPAHDHQAAAEAATLAQVTGTGAYDVILVDAPLSLVPRPSGAPDNR